MADAPAYARSVGRSLDRGLFVDLLKGADDGMPTTAFDPRPLLLAFSGGVITTLVGAYVAHLLRTSAERRQRLRNAHLEIYMLLREYDYYHFWICAVHHPVMNYEEIKEKAEAARQKLFDTLRGYDESPFVARIITIAFSGHYKLEEDRNGDLSRLLKDMERSISPRLTTALDQVFRRNERLEVMAKKESPYRGIAE